MAIVLQTRPVHDSDYATQHTGYSRRALPVIRFCDVYRLLRLGGSLSHLRKLVSVAYIEDMSQSKLVVVQSYGNEGEAYVAKGALESSGIDAMIQADTAGRMREHLAWSGLGHRLLVREEDAAAARSILCLPQSDELQLLQRYVMDTQADIPQGALLSAGIFATVRYDGMYYELLVSKEDAEAARKVLKALS